MATFFNNKGTLILDYRKTFWHISSVSTKLYNKDKKFQQNSNPIIVLYNNKKLTLKRISFKIGLQFPKGQPNSNAIQGFF